MPASFPIHRRRENLTQGETVQSYKPLSPEELERKLAEAAAQYRPLTDEEVELDVRQGLSSAVKEARNSAEFRARAYGVFLANKTLVREFIVTDFSKGGFLLWTEVAVSRTKFVSIVEAHTS